MRKMKSATPLITVIVPCYNQGRYLGEAVNSVLSQSYSHLECLVIDDGSPDETAEVLADLCRIDSRVTMLRHADGMNHGLAASRNIGIEAARGEYIGILDADDCWLPDKLDKQVKVFQQFPEIGLVYGQAVNVPLDDPGRTMLGHGKENCFVQGGIRENNNENPFWATRMLLWGNLIPCPTPLIRRSILGPYRFEQGPVCRRLGLHFEDYLMWLFLSTTTRFYFIDQPLALYRVHQQQVSKEFIEGTVSLQVMDGFEEVFDLFVKQAGETAAKAVTPADLRQALGGILFRGRRPLLLSQLPSLVSYAFRYRCYIKLFNYLARRFVRGFTRRLVDA